MLKGLVEQAVRLPVEVEKAAVEAQQLKQDLYELAEMQKRLEAEIASEVANERNGEGKPKFPNDAARQGEISHRILASEKWRGLKRDVDQARKEWWEAEARLERMKLEHRSTIALLDVVAGAIRAGKSPEEAEGLLAADCDTPASKPSQNGGKPTVTQDDTTQGGGNGKENGGGLRQATVKVLEARPGKSEGTVRAWCEAEDGDKVAVFGKNGTAKKLAASIGEKVRVEYREGDYGWFAVKVA
ncbi:MAG TPA: hypothetical protein GX513_02260 [Firmicutes bacterium]|nr:hypothetical protein [Bacillota bacterium]